LSSGGVTSGYFVASSRIMSAIVGQYARIAASLPTPTFA
jgi:hypothetical protein